MALTGHEAQQSFAQQKHYWADLPLSMLCLHTEEDHELAVINWAAWIAPMYLLATRLGLPVFGLQLSLVGINYRIAGVGNAEGLKRT